MLWQHYVFRRGLDVHTMWDQLFEKRPIRLLFITGRGFDVRARVVMRAFVENVRSPGIKSTKQSYYWSAFRGITLVPN